MVKLSICIGTYQVSDYLELLLNSIKQSDADNYEILIDIDGSSDESLNVSRKHGIEPSGIGTHRGFCSPLNDCIKRSKGEYIATIASDQVLPRKWWKSTEKWLHPRRYIQGMLLEPFKEGSAFPFCDAGTSAETFNFGKFDRMARKFQDSKPIYPTKGDAKYYAFEPHIIHRSVFDDVGFFDTRFDRWGHNFDEFPGRMLKSHQNYEFAYLPCFTVFHFSQRSRKRADPNWEILDANKNVEEAFSHLGFKTVQEIMDALAKRGRTIYE